MSRRSHTITRRAAIRWTGLAPAFGVLAGWLVLGERPVEAMPDAESQSRPAAPAVQPRLAAPPADRPVEPKPIARPPFFALPPSFWGQASGARGGAALLGASPRPSASSAAFGRDFAGIDESAFLLRGEPAMLSIRADPLPGPPAAGLPVATGSVAGGGAPRGFLQEIYGTMASPDAVASPKHWTATHDPDLVPSRFIKGRPITTRSPDLEFDVNGRTSLGVYGEVTKPEKGDPLNGTALPKTKDHGAGVTLQYRFDSR